MTEIWKPVCGYEGRYMVSSLGRVKSLRNDHILKPTFRGCYLSVLLFDDVKAKRHSVHLLVCKAFHGPKPSKWHITNHRDCVKTNNNSENLEWVTHKGNVAHAFENGLMKVRSGDEHWTRQKQHRGKIEAMRKEYLLISPKGRHHLVSGVQECAALMGVTRGTFFNTLKGEFVKPRNGWKVVPTSSTTLPIGG